MRRIKQIGSIVYSLTSGNVQRGTFQKQDRYMDEIVKSASMIERLTQWLHATDKKQSDIIEDIKQPVKHSDTVSKSVYAQLNEMLIIEPHPAKSDRK